MAATENEALVKLDSSASEVLPMLRYQDEDVVFGRNYTGLDVNEFDVLSPYLTDVTAEQLSAGAGDAIGAVERFRASNGQWDPFDEEAPAPFEAPAAPQFPVFSAALRRFQEAETSPRVVRVDDESSYGAFMCEAAVKELDRRLRELRGAVEQHLADHHGGPVSPLSQWDVLGAAKVVTRLRGATDARDAAEKMPQVALDLPDYARGAVRCWRDGGHVVVSIDFQAADGSPRTATSAAPMSSEVDEVAGWALRQGHDAVSVLGALPDLAAAATGRRLVREVAGAALEAHRRLDVCGMRPGAGPVIIFGGAEGGSAPLAALMYLQQRCDAGDAQACREMGKIQAAATSPVGQRVAAPLLAEAQRRLDAGRAQAVLGSARKTLASSYAEAAGWV